MGYVQGMCDLLAPLLVVLDNGEGPSCGGGQVEHISSAVGIGLMPARERKRRLLGLEGWGCKPALSSGPQDTPCEVRHGGPLPCQPHSHLPSDQLAYSCFSHHMKRMSQNFPNGGAMDTHFANMRSLIQVRSAAARGLGTRHHWAHLSPTGRPGSVLNMPFSHKLSIFH